MDSAATEVRPLLIMLAYIGLSIKRDRACIGGLAEAKKIAPVGKGLRL